MDNAKHLLQLFRFPAS